ncbi:MAG TPA: 4Fe-4S dicluster domain-containing protein, partial [Bacteroidales bacterium]|nr:4Fe-4S dicluster domain-containing protein [Bacteroidales bacterium]
MEKYYRSLDEYKKGPDTKFEKAAEEEQKNLVIDLAADKKISEAKASRRDFLKLVGFSFATAAITSSCEKPVQKAIPYLIKPEEVTPGKSNYYATSFFDGNEFCSVVVKVRDGRPIKIEANERTGVSGKGTSARAQASVLELYDQARLKSPAKGRKKATWEEIDSKVIEKLSATSSGRKVLVTPTIISPSLKLVINELQQKYSDLEWITYDEVSAEAVRLSHEKIFGKGIIPGYHFDKARAIVSFDADFLGTWLSPVKFASDYAQTREVSKEHPEMSKHYQFEAGYTLTGSNADERIPVSASKAKAILTKLYNTIAAKTGGPGVTGATCDYDVAPVAEVLLDNQGASIVISGSNDEEVQLMVAGLNAMLGNYGSTLDMAHYLNLRQGSDKAFKELKKDALNNNVSLLLLSNVNPVYSDPGGDALEDAIGNAELSVYMGSNFSETAKACHYVAPDHHYLESWGDASPEKGAFCLQQPTINPLYDSRSVMESLLTWGGSEQTAYDKIKEYWQNMIYPLSGQTQEFKDWWNAQLQNGMFQSVGGRSENDFTPDLSAVSSSGVASDQGMTLNLYNSVAMVDGRHANNPWLQELPDPVTKVCWDNYLSVSVQDAEEMGLEDEDVVVVKGVKVPVLIQPGQAKGTCSLALGYGRTVAGKVGEMVGVNAYKFLSDNNRLRNYTITGVAIEKTGEQYALARTQTHHNMEERPIVREASLDAYKKDPAAGNHYHEYAEGHHASLYPDTEFDGYHWGLAIDLNKCVACNNCVVSCIAENNIATVGKEEVKNRRIMHWMRLDRYYSDEIENPKTYHQPVMCQHCDNAPCENVCPVAATMHSDEGLNQVAYVRCIG